MPGVATENDVVAMLMQSIATRRLVVVSGAGLSVATPSDVPSAKLLAQKCAETHRLLTGNELPPETQGDIEQVADYFYQKNQFESYFVNRLVDWAPFRRNPNPGHQAIADFLGARVIEFSLTCNMDELVEVAARGLGDVDFVAALDGNEAGTARPHSTLLKLHGCCARHREKTLWCRTQLQEDERKQSLQASRQWLTGHLMEKDALFVGFWTDWEYLNEVLMDSVASAQPRMVALVDPAPADDLRAKAPLLWQWAEGAQPAFYHVRRSGAEFLDELRRQYSEQFLTRTAEAGRPIYQQRTGADFASPITFTGQTSEQLYALRRDVTGRASNEVVRVSEPDSSMGLLGAVLLRLLTGGAVLDDGAFRIGSKRVRVVHAAGTLLSQAQARLGVEETPHQPDIVVCVGADDDGGVPDHLLRGDTPATVVRQSSGGTWLPHNAALQHLGV